MASINEMFEKPGQYVSSLIPTSIRNDISNEEVLEEAETYVKNFVSGRDDGNYSLSAGFYENEFGRSEFRLRYTYEPSDEGERKVGKTIIPVDNEIGEDEISQWFEGGLFSGGLIDRIEELDKDNTSVSSDIDWGGTD